MTDYINNEIIGFTETQIAASDYTCKIIETLSFPNISFNKTMKINKFSSFLTDVEMMLETISIYIIAGYFNGYRMTMLENNLRCFHRPCPDGIKTNTYSWIFDSSSLREKCPKYGVFSGPYSVRMRENTDQKKLCIWTLFTQCICLYQEIFDESIFP